MRSSAFPQFSDALHNALRTFLAKHKPGDAPIVLRSAVNHLRGEVEDIAGFRTPNSQI